MEATMSGQAPRQTDGHLVHGLLAIQFASREPGTQLFRSTYLGLRTEPIALGGAYWLVDHGKGDQVFAVVHDEA
jgi:hypothetical protein